MEPIVVAVTGQLAAGKSTVARAFLARFPFGYHVDIDGIREGVVSGMASPIAWSDETTRQFGIAVRASAAIAAVYLRAGFAVAVEGSVDPDSLDRDLAATGVPYVGIVLLPAAEVAIERNHARTTKGFDTTVLDPVIRQLDVELHTRAVPAGWTVMDNSGEAVEATVDRILRLVPEPAFGERGAPQAPGSGGTV
jgi:adenylylsulfate kinase-like enzyme